MPGAAAKLDAYGNMGRGQIVQILSQLQAFNLAGSDANATSSKRSKAKRSKVEYFVAHGGESRQGHGSWKHGDKMQHLRRGVWARYRFSAGSAVKPVLLFVYGTRYGKRFDFVGTAQRVINARFKSHYEQRMQKQLAKLGLSSGGQGACRTASARLAGASSTTRRPVTRPEPLHRQRFLEQPPVSQQTFQHQQQLRSDAHEIKADAAMQWVFDMTEIVRDDLAFQEPWASAIAHEIVQGMRARFGGDDVYVPAPDKSARDERVREMFNGRNIKELMQLFGLARSTVYRIVRQRGRP